MEHLKNNRNRSVEQSMKRRCLRIYRKRRKKKLIILILTCILFLGTAAAFAIIVEAVWFILVQTNFGEKKEKEKEPSC